MSLRRATKRIEKVYGQSNCSEQEMQLPKSVRPPCSPPMLQRSSRMFPRRKRQLLRSPEQNRLRTAILSAIASLMGYLLLVAANHFILSASHRTANIPTHPYNDDVSLGIVFHRAPSNRTPIQRPPDMNVYDKLDSRKPDHGGLNLRLLLDVEQRGEARAIHVDFGLNAGYEDLVNGPEDDDWREGYFAMDDDAERNPYAMWDDDAIQDERRCRRTSWHREFFPNCNRVHEYDTVEYVRANESKFVGTGAYRTVFLTSDQNLRDSSVLKTLKFDLEFNFEHFEYMRMDGLISEKLSWSERIVDMFAFCGVSMIGEALEHGNLMDAAVPKGGYLSESVTDTDVLLNFSPFTPERKVELALDMVEAVALLHSFSGGVIVHDDIQLSQFLFTSDGSLKLNDFNRAEIMLFDEEHQEYCRYRNNPGMGDWRSPEEYDNRPLNEKIDVWSLGNNMYAILTGLFPFYESNDVPLIQTKIQQGETGFIDHRYMEKSVAEARLVEIVQLCWEYDVEKRPDIFQLLDMLRPLVDEQRSRGRSSPLLIRLDESNQMKT